MPTDPARPSTPPKPPGPQGASADRGPAGVRLTRRYRSIEGYAYGFRQPVFQYELEVAARPPGPLGLVGRLAPLDEALQAGLELPPLAAQARSPQRAVVERLMAWTTALLRRASHPVLEPPRLLRQVPGPVATFVVAQPCLHAAATFAAVQALVKLLDDVIEGRLAPPALTAAAAQVLAQQGTTAARFGLQGFNTLHFVQAAFELGVPWRLLQGQLIQVGHGAQGRWLSSSWTDRTPVLASNLARNKVAAADLLRQAGVPVPQHHLAADADEAVSYAEQLRYPVVVKPADQDGGAGVKTGLDSAPAVRAAFAEARALSSLVLVERHVPGRDFRVQVVQGAVQGVLERVPGGVVGNGQDTVRTLLERQNEERRTATDDRRYLYAMALDDEACRLLADQGLAPDAVPAAGRAVRLRGASNVASGGTPVEWPLDQVHPDNARLAVRAARVLRLDVAGIDLLIPDIGRSWLETGAHICEVNAMPQMFTTMHKPMLRSLLQGGTGRIPVVVVVEPDRADLQVARRVHRQLQRRGLVTGLASGTELLLGADRLAPSPGGCLAGARMLLLDASLQALVLAVMPGQPMGGGWPVDACDVLVLHGTDPKGLPLAQSLRPHTVLVNADTAAGLRGARALFGAAVRAMAWQAGADLPHLAEAAVAALPIGPA